MKASTQIERVGRWRWLISLWKSQDLKYENSTLCQKSRSSIQGTRNLNHRNQKDGLNRLTDWLTDWLTASSIFALSISTYRNALAKFFHSFDAPDLLLRLFIARDARHTILFSNVTLTWEKYPWKEYFELDSYT